MKFYLVLILFFVFAPFSEAQTVDTVVVLDEVVLEYVRLSNDSLDNLYATGTTHTIDYQTIQQENSPTVNEVLRKVPGVHIKNYGGIGGLKTVSVRGLGGQHTAILLNNNLLTDQKSGQVDLSSISTLGISAIQFNIGSVADVTSSAKTYAYNNSINFEENPMAFLKNKKRKVIAGIGVGSFQSYQPYFNLFTKTSDSSALGVVYESLFSKGNYPYKVTEEGERKELTREHSNYQRHLFKANWQNENTKRKLQINGVYRLSEQELPGAVILYNPQNGQDVSAQQGILQFAYQTKKQKYNKVIRGSFNHDLTTYTDKYYANSTGGIFNSYRQTNVFGSLGLNRVVKSFQFFLVSDVEYGKLATNLITGSPYRVANYTVLGAKFTKGRLVVEGNLLGTFVQDNDAEETKKRHRTTGYLGANYQLIENKDIYLKTGYKTSYRLPTFSDLYYNNIGNKDLVPETTRQFNLGIAGAFKSKWAEQFYYSLNGYYGEIDNKIIAVPTQNLFVWSMRNIGKVVNYGTELSILYKSKPLIRKSHLGISYAYTLQKVTDRSDKESNTYNKQIVFTPQEIINLRVTAHLNPQLSFYWNGQFIGHQFYLPENVYDNLIDGVTLHEIGLNYKLKIKKKIEVTYLLSVRNLTNKQYHLVRSFPMRGRNIWTSLIFTI